MRTRTRLAAAALAATTALALLAPTAAPAGAAGPIYSFSNFGAGGGLSNTETFDPPGDTPVVGDFVGSDEDDIVWYTPGAGGDAIWSSHGDLGFTTLPASVSGTFRPLVGYFADDLWQQSKVVQGEPKQDILWYSTTGTTSQLWDFNEDGSITKTALIGVGGSGTTLVGRFDGNETDDLIRYRPGAGAEAFWTFNNDGAPTAKAMNVNGTYTPLVANLDAATTSDEIFWYAPGTAADSIWTFTTNATWTSAPKPVNGTFTPVAGAISNDGYEDILWYAAGSAPDSYWDFEAGGAITKHSLSVNGTYTPYICDCIQNGTSPYTDILWVGAGNKADVVWEVFSTELARTTRTYTSPNIDGSAIVALGRFTADGKQTALVRW